MCLFKQMFKQIHVKQPMPAIKIDVQERSFPVVSFLVSKEAITRR